MIEYRGIEVTAKNYSYALRHLREEGQADSDLAMQIEATFGGGGFARAASYLLEVPAEHRSAVIGEAHVIENMVGGRYADRVWEVVQSVKRGDLRFTYTERAREIARVERENRDQQFRMQAAALVGQH
jgi:hypothetical protein